LDLSIWIQSAKENIRFKFAMNQNINSENTVTQSIVFCSVLILLLVYLKKADCVVLVA